MRRGRELSNIAAFPDVFPDVTPYAAPVNVTGRAEPIVNATASAPKRKRFRLWWWKDETESPASTSATAANTTSSSVPPEADTNSTVNIDDMSAEQKENFFNDLLKNIYKYFGKEDVWIIILVLKKLYKVLQDI